VSALLDGRTTEGRLWEALPESAVRCFACGHRCLIREGRRGICRVRFNQGGRLLVPHGYVAALQCDPVEKKPFFHVLPGADALTFGMLGCDFHCGYCQNWLTSQALRDDQATTDAVDITVESLVALAERQDARLIVSSYNEPLITAEWAVEVFHPARARGFLTGFVSNGNATAEALDFIRPLTDCYKIDLKTMSDRRYRQLGGVLAHVLDAIGLVYERGIWLEVLTLIIPGFSDDPADLRAAARYIAAIDHNIPWHVTAFHEDYKFRGMGNTTADVLVRACEIGAEEGLNFVYAGNLPGRVGRWEHTWCPECHTLLVERFGYHILQNRIGNGGACPDCRAGIPGIFANPRGSSQPSRGHGRIRTVMIGR
jgi:pyruvate formate lyase activating enzyme